MSKKGWSEGKPHTEDHKAKIAAKLKGRKPWNAGKKIGNAHIWNKGGTLSADHKLKISETLRGRIPWNKKNDTDISGDTGSKSTGNSEDTK